MRGPDGQLTSKLNFALLDAAGNIVRTGVRILEPEVAGALNSDAELELVWDGAGWGIFSSLGSNPPLDLYYYRLHENGDSWPAQFKLQILRTLNSMLLPSGMVASTD